MMGPTDFGNLDDRPRGGDLSWADVERILGEREMRSSPVIVGEVADEDAAEVSLAEDEHVIQALAPDGADEPFREGILPRALRRPSHRLNTSGVARRRLARRRRLSRVWQRT